MAEILSPGVFVEEVPSQAVTVQPVSTSNMGIVGATQRGPTNEATLVTSFAQYERIFGEQISDSRTHLSMAAYYANGGRRAFVVRVMPSDALTADADVRSSRTNTLVETGDGAATVYSQAGGSALDTWSAPSTVSLRWRSDDTPVAVEVMRNRDDTANALLLVSIQKYEARVDPSSLPVIDPSLPSISPSATVTVTYNPGGGDQTIVLTPPTGAALTSTTTTGQGSVVQFDWVTGFLSIEFAGTEIIGVVPTGSLRLSYTPQTATRTITDDGAGTFVGAGIISAGTVDYDTGDWTFTALGGQLPGSGCPVLADYQVQAWDLSPSSVGTWANDMRLDVIGNEDFYDVATATYSRFDVSVLLLNSATGSFDVFETYEEVSFTDPDSSQYFPEVVNDLSDLMTVGGTAVHEEAPAQLSGRAITEVVAGGDEGAGNRLIVTTLNGGAVSPRTVVISYQDAAGVAKVVTDNGVGAFIGDVDVAGANTINYTTGAIDVTLSVAVNAATLVLATYYTTPAETTHSERFGDTTKLYTDGVPVIHYRSGTNGTFTNTANYGRNQLTSSSLLEANYDGLYALNRVDELMQVVIPDFAGDATISKDLIDYVEARSSQPSGGDRFAILMTPSGQTAQEAVDFLRFSLAQYSKFAALYWPWVKVADPLRDNRPTLFPPLGHIAGIYARTDNNRNVGKAPGGTIDGALRYLTGLEKDPTQGERDFVYPKRINSLIATAQTGLAVWGVRTLSQESEWRYINARRLFMFVERSVFNSTHWIVFENNGPALWARIKAQLQGFLLSLYNVGLFAGNTPAQGFFITVDESNNLPETVDAGQVIIDVGIAANKPAEFVRFRFQQKTLSA